jgi:protein involved in polysaccharide export with SLBB domain
MPEFGKEPLLRRERFATFSTVRNTLGAAALAAALAVSSGCDTKSLFDPSETAGRTYKQGDKILPVQILDNIDPTIEEMNPEFAGAVEPTAEDAKLSVEDYKLTPNDLIRITISDLEGPGVQTLLEKRVSETGNISLPYVGQVKVGGLSEGQLEESIVRKYGPEGVNIIQRANVSVTLVEARGRTFSILGAINRPGQYAILQSDFRVLDALVLGSDTSSPLIDTLYIIRKIDTTPATGPVTGPSDTGKTPATLPPTRDDLAPETPPPPGAAAPRSDAQRALEAALRPAQLAVATQAPAGAAPAADDLAPDAPKPAAAPATPTAPAPAPGANGGVGADTGNANSRIINVEGQDVTADPGGPAAAGPTPGTAMSPTTRGFTGFNDIAAPRDVKVIKVPLDLLRRGDLKYNIPIRSNDRIIAQNLEIGEYYMGGHIARPGAYTLTGRRITLKQAVTAASGLDQLAIPQRTDIIRRINKNQEVFVRVDLAQVFEGARPDIYLKPDDQVMVGTNMLAPFLAAARGAFRFTYGLGFLYDRNFAYDQNGNIR